MHIYMGVYTCAFSIDMNIHIMISVNYLLGIFSLLMIIDMNF